MNKHKKKKLTRRPAHSDRQRVTSLQYSTVAPRSGQGVGRKKNQPNRRIDDSIAIGRRPLWQRIPMIVAVGIIVTAVLYTFVVDYDAQVNVVHPEETHLSSEQIAHIWNADEYKTATQTYLQQSWFNRLKFTMQRDVIAQKLQEQYPEIAFTEIRLALIDRRPIIRITPREPRLLVSAPDDNMYLIDRSGYAFAKLENVATDNTSLPLVLDQIGGIDTTVGEPVLPMDTVRFIEATATQFRKLDIEVESMSLPAVANELHVKPADVNYIGKFDITSDARIQAGTFIATYNMLQDDNVVPDEYIDARVQGRAYYR